MVANAVVTDQKQVIHKMLISRNNNYFNLKKSYLMSRKKLKNSRLLRLNYDNNLLSSSFFK